MYQAVHAGGSIEFAGDTSFAGVWGSVLAHRNAFVPCTRRDGVRGDPRSLLDELDTDATFVHGSLRWAAAALLIALPGMFGEALVLSRFSRFMPRLRSETGSRYAAFLFATYGLVLAVCEMVTLRAR
jgi:hypothetical protein